MFLDQKSEIFKKSEKSKFSKAVGQCFFSKIGIFSHGHFLDTLSKKSLVFLCSGQKRMLFTPEKRSFKKVRKNEICERG